MSRPPERPNPVDVVDDLCKRLIAGEGVTSICSDSAMPAKAVFYEVMAENEEFRTRIARARELAQEAEIDKTIDMADAATIEDYQVVKLRIWARQWRAAKIAPRKYGDKIAIGGADDLPAIKADVTLSPDEAYLQMIGKR